MITLVLIVLLGLYLIDRVCLYLEAKGWLYYRNNKPSGGIVGNTLLELNSLLHPASRHTIEIRQNQVQYKRREEDVPSDPSGEK